MRIISKGGIAPHHIVFVKARGPDTISSLKIIFHGDHDGTDMPPVIIIIPEGGSMAGTSCKPTQFDTQGVRLIQEPAGGITQGLVRHGHPICITTELRARSSILEISYNFV